MTWLKYNYFVSINFILINYFFYASLIYFPFVIEFRTFKQGVGNEDGCDREWGF